MSAQTSASDDPESTQLRFQRFVNAAQLEELMKLYEPCGAIVRKDGKVVTGLGGIREHLSGLLLLKPTLQSTVVNKIEVDGVAMLFSEWNLRGTFPNGDPLSASGKSFDVARRQPDGTWLIAIDSPYGIMP